jgi:hypothetical protein
VDALYFANFGELARQIAHLWITRACLAVAALDVADYFEQERDVPLDFVEPFSSGLAVTTLRYSLHRLCISPGWFTSRLTGVHPEQLDEAFWREGEPSKARQARAPR